MPTKSDLGSVEARRPWSAAATSLQLPVQEQLTKAAIPWQERPAGSERRDVAARGESDHRPASHAGGARNLQQRGGGVRRWRLWGCSAWRSGAASRTCTSAGATTGWSGISSRSGLSFVGRTGSAVGLFLRSAIVPDRRHVLHHVVRRAQRSDDQRGADSRLSAFERLENAFPALQS